MKILLHYPKWGNRWSGYIEAALREHEVTVSHSEQIEEIGKLSEDKDLLFSMWANEVVIFWTRCFKQKKIATFMRRYEVWETGLMENIDWSSVDALFFVSAYFKRLFNAFWPGVEAHKQHIVQNGIDCDKFPLRPNRTGTKKIALVCQIKNVKNIPLACQILLELPTSYTIHHIGLPHTSQICGQTMSYVKELGFGNRFVFEGRIDPSDVPAWLQDKDFILSTSINEGNPNNVLEAMAMGIKPIIHAWPGARDQFPEQYIFTTVNQAVQQIMCETYIPWQYRDWIETHYSLKNFEKITEVVNDLAS